MAGYRDHELLLARSDSRLASAAPAVIGSAVLQAIHYFTVESLTGLALGLPRKQFTIRRLLQQYKTNKPENQKRKEDSLLFLFRYDQSSIDVGLVLAYLILILIQWLLPLQTGLRSMMTTRKTEE